MSSGVRRAYSYLREVRGTRMPQVIGSGVALNAFIE